MTRAGAIDDEAGGPEGSPGFLAEHPPVRGGAPETYNLSGILEQVKKPAASHAAD